MLQLILHLSVFDWVEVVSIRVGILCPVILEASDICICVYAVTTATLASLAFWEVWKMCSEMFRQSRFVSVVVLDVVSLEHDSSFVLLEVLRKFCMLQSSGKDP